jgi:hypothetical protein
MQPQPLLVLADVEAGARWFQQVLGLRSGHGGSEYEMLMDGDTLVVQLHDWGADEHDHLGDPNDPSRGNGVLLWFATDDFDRAMAKVIEHDAEVLEGPFANANS